MRKLTKAEQKVVDIIKAQIAEQLWPSPWKAALRDARLVLGVGVPCLPVVMIGWVVVQPYLW